MLPALTYNALPIRDRGDMLCLTDMWKAAGADPARRPADWLRSADAERFIGVLAEIVGNSHSLVQSAGRGGTWGHWQLALAYAKYVSPEFHHWCNTIVRAHMEGRLVEPEQPPHVVVAAVVEEVRKTIGGIVKSVVNRQLETVLPQMIEDRLARDPREIVVGYVSVNELLAQDWKIPSKGRRSIQRKVFNRLFGHFMLTKQQALRCARTGTWLFPPDAARAFISEHCVELIRAHLDRLRGQGVLNFAEERRRRSKPQP